MLDACQGESEQVCQGDVRICGPAYCAPASALKPYVYALPEEAKSKELCEAVAGRIFVKVGSASECIAYFVTKGHEKKTHAVMFLDGDISLEKFQDPSALARGTLARRKFMQQWAGKMGQRFVDISRVGVKMRTRAKHPGRVGGSTKAVSERLNSCAIFCIVLASKPAASGNTASGLPSILCSVKTSTIR